MTEYRSNAFWDGGKSSVEKKKKKVTKCSSFLQWQFYCCTLNALENTAGLN